MGGSIHWSSKRQAYTARSPAEAEIGAINNCTKALQKIRKILVDPGVLHLFVTGPITIHNDNAAAFQWSKNMTNKVLRCIWMGKNAVCKQVLEDFISVKHLAGCLNVSNIFTKGDRDVAHFCAITDVLLDNPLP